MLSAVETMKLKAIDIESQIAGAEIWDSAYVPLVQDFDDCIKNYEQLIEAGMSRSVLKNPKDKAYAEQVVELISKIQESFKAFITSNGSVSFKTFTNQFSIFAGQLRRIQRPKEQPTTHSPQTLPSATFNPSDFQRPDNIVQSRNHNSEGHSSGFERPSSRKLAQKSMPRDSFVEPSFHDEASRVSERQQPIHFDFGNPVETDQSQRNDFGFGLGQPANPKSTAFNPDKDFFGQTTNQLSQIKSKNSSSSHEVTHSISHKNQDFLQDPFPKQEQANPPEKNFWEDNWTPLPNQTKPQVETEDPFKKKRDRAISGFPQIEPFFDQPAKEPIRSSIVKSSRDALESIIKHKTHSPEERLVNQPPQIDNGFGLKFKESEVSEQPPNCGRQPSEEEPDPVPLRNLISNPIPEQKFFSSQIEDNHSQPQMTPEPQPSTEDKNLSARTSTILEPEAPASQEKPAATPGEVIITQPLEWHQDSPFKLSKHAAMQTLPIPVEVTPETNQSGLPADIREKMMNLERENVRLRETNRILTSQLTNAARASQRPQPSHSPPPAFTAPKTDPLLSLEQREKELYKQKYTELFEKYKREKEEDKLSSQLHDPATYLEMSKINEDLLREKRLLVNRLEEEKQKSKMVEFYKSELSKAKEDLIKMTKEFNRQLVQFSKLSVIADDSLTKSPKQAGERSRIGKEGTILPDNISQDRNTVKYGAYSTSMRLTNEKLVDMLSAPLGPKKNSMHLDQDKKPGSSSEEVAINNNYDSKPKSSQPTQKLRQFFGKTHGQVPRSPNSDSFNQDLNYSLGFLDNFGKGSTDEAKFVSDSRLKPRPATSVIETKQQSFNLYKNTGTISGKSQINDEKSDRSISSAMNLYSKNKNSAPKTARSGLDGASILSTSQNTSKEQTGLQRHKDAVARLHTNKGSLFDKK